MKKFCVFLFCIFFSLSADAVEINKIEPAFWFTSMKNPQLQLMVYGDKISSSKVNVSYPGVRLKKVVKADSPNYVFVYLNVSKNARPGHIKLNFCDEKECKVVYYELKKRSQNSPSRKGFDSSDVVYLIMVDRFSNGNEKNDNISWMQPYKTDRKLPDSRHGGDIAGIRNNIDYFSNLGVSALWLTPVLENNMPGGSYHGYAITDFYNVDPRFGSNKEYADFVAEAHSRGLKVIADMVFNHCGTGHRWLVDPPFSNWFNNNDYKNNFVQTSFCLLPQNDPYASKYDTKKFEDGWFVREMPDLNQRNQHLMRYLIQNSIWWIEYANLDGIRMDTFPYADFDAMSKWQKELNFEYPNFNTVGEIFDEHPAQSAYWQKNSKLAYPKNSNLKTVMDFSFFSKINKAKNEQTDSSEQGLNRIYENFAYDWLYQNPSSVLAFLDNHDTDRFLQSKTQIPQLKQALTLLLTTKRIPQIYYGTEILMSGSKSKNDGFVRQDFPGGWHGDLNNAFVDSQRTDAQREMFDYTQKLLSYRRGNKLISQGSMIHYKPENGVYVYARNYEGRTLFVALNGTNQQQELSLNNYKESLRDKEFGYNVLEKHKIDLNKSLILKPYESLLIEF